MTPAEMREHATNLILDHARDVEYLSISESLEDQLDGLSGDEQDDICNQIDDLISKATITVEWPEEPSHV